MAQFEQEPFEQQLLGQGPGTAVELAAEVMAGPAAAAPEGRYGPRRRRRLLLVVMACAVVLSAGGLASALVIKSPAQAAAEAGPPVADVLTAPVEKRVLTATVVVRGQVTAAQSVDVAPVAPGGQAGGRAVVTKLPLKAGDPILAGQSVLEVSGRPVFALPGELPVYRDLRPGTTGQDVAQLQRALGALGFGSAGDRPGTFGEATKAAVEAFYAARGYDPLPAAPDGDAQLSAARDAVTAADRAASDARDALAEAARSGGAGTAPDAKGTATDAKGTTPDAKGAAPSSGAARKQVDRTAQDLALARQRLAAVEAANGAMVPAAELLFLSGFPARVDGIAAQVGSEVTGRVLTVSAGALVVHGTLSPSDQGLVHPGQQVQILSELTGTTAAGTVDAVADTMDDGRGQSGQPGTGGAPGTTPQQGAGSGQPGYRMTVRPTDPLRAELAGQDVRLSVQSASSAGPVLVVPLSAVSAGADGRTVVTVYQDGRRRPVEVTPGTVGGGSVEVRPAGADQLREGDQVIVGVGAAGGREGAR
ncbi:peptidoglycan-binding protein [Kitasatospora sp. NPDC094015]|uniref:peptidoglycan-binding protein n=1 Tax=Kitasatospora sp. NPDC094015 TaxID=3155205 RepID=UPI003327DF7E